MVLTSSANVAQIDGIPSHHGGHGLADIDRREPESRIAVDRDPVAGQDDAQRFPFGTNVGLGMTGRGIPLSSHRNAKKDPCLKRESPGKFQVDITERLRRRDRQVGQSVEREIDFEAVRLVTRSDNTYTRNGVECS